MLGLAWLACQWRGVHSPRPNCSGCVALRDHIAREIKRHHRLLTKKLRASDPLALPPVQDPDRGRVLRRVREEGRREAEAATRRQRSELRRER